MKRKWVIGIALLALLAFAIPAFAVTDQATDAKAWFDQMFAAKKSAVDQAVKDGRITEEQGKAWKDNFDKMYELRQQNGFTCPGGGPGAGGFGRGQGGCGFGGGKWGGQTPVAPAPTN